MGVCVGGGKWRGWGEKEMEFAEFPAQICLLSVCEEAAQSHKTYNPHLWIIRWGKAASISFK